MMGACSHPLASPTDLIGFHPECLATLDANLLERYANMTLQKRAVETVTSDDDSAVSLLE